MTGTRRVAVWRALSEWRHYLVLLWSRAISNGSKKVELDRPDDWTNSDHITFTLEFHNTRVLVLLQIIRHDSQLASCKYVCLTFISWFVDILISLPLQLILVANAFWSAICHSNVWAWPVRKYSGLSRSVCCFQGKIPSQLCVYCCLIVLQSNDDPPFAMSTYGRYLSPRNFIRHIFAAKRSTRNVKAAACLFWHHTWVYPLVQQPANQR